MFEPFGSRAEGKSDSSFSWTFLQGFLAKPRKKRFLSPCSVHTMENMLPPASSEQCLTFEIPFSPSSSLSQTLILVMILTRDYFEASCALLPSSSCITELPLSLPCPACARAREAGLIFLIPEQAELPSCLALPADEASWASL